MTIVTNGSHIHVYARAHTHVYTSICKSIVTFVTGRQATARDNIPRVGGQIPRDPALHAALWAISSFEIDDRFSKPLKNLQILNLVQIGDAICPLAVLSAKGSELWGRCCDGTR